MFLGALNLKIPPVLVAEFEKQAKQSFPKEHFAYWFGHQEGNRIDVMQIWVPDDVGEFSSDKAVRVQKSWTDRAKRIAHRGGMVVLGDHHSHPYTATEIMGRQGVPPDVSPSEADWDLVRPGVLMGITLIRESPSGNLRARTKFWGPLVPVREVA